MPFVKYPPVRLFDIPLVLNFIPSVYKKKHPKGTRFGKGLSGILRFV